MGVGTAILDLSAAAPTIVPAHAALFSDGTLDALLAAGPAVWHEVRTAVAEHVAAAVESLGTIDAREVRLQLPFTVADYVDFYASEHHATNVGRIFRPDGDALTPNWKHLPIGYHGRSGTIVASDTPVRRPAGQRRNGDGSVEFGPSIRLDIEAEVGYVVGTPSTMGEPVAIDQFDQHVFGICVVNDWSARDIQAWEYVPLGPLLGKSFATSVSPWIVPLDALQQSRIAPPERDHDLMPYLRDREPWGLDLELQIELNGTRVSKPTFSSMYWTGAQMLAHMTINGASLRTGDLFASGTVSGAEPGERGSLLELSWNGSEPLTLDDGTTRTYLLDGDTVTISAYAVSDSQPHQYLGAVTGTITAALTTE
ncbi:fumarylacetoacetase [Aeromicrobium fastidiosum]|nr:fumarylacetoacetase [Aeromicrobium fastidiosum]